MTESFKVKGSVLKTKLAFVKERFGEQAFQATLDRVIGPDFAGPILDSTWYPFSVYDSLILSIAKDFFDGRVNSLREVGAYSAEKALTGVYRAFAYRGTLPDFLQRMTAFHSTLYSAGRAEVDIQDEVCTVALLGLPTYSSAEAEVNSGYLTAAARKFGHPNASTAYRLRADGAVFTITLSGTG